MKTRHILSVLIVIILTFSACGGNQRTTQDLSARAAVIEEFRGSVNAVQVTGNMPAFRGLALLRQDRLITFADAWVSLELTEGRFAFIEENSEVFIEKLADAAGRDTGLVLVDGKVWVHIADELEYDENFEIITPSVVLAVRGTTFAAEVSGDDMVLTVFEGAVEASADDEILFVAEPGRVTVRLYDGVISEIIRVPLTLDDIDPLFRFGEEGPGGAFEKLREMLKDYVWDEEDNFFIQYFGEPVAYLYIGDELPDADIPVVTAPVAVFEAAANEARQVNEAQEAIIRDYREVLNRFEYTDLSVRFEWEPSPLNPELIGRCRIEGRLLGDTSDVANVLVAVALSRNVSEANILHHAVNIVPRWRESYETPLDAENVSIFNGGFSIHRNQMGQSGEMLMIVLDRYLNPLGHLIIPITIPANPN